MKMICALQQPIQRKIWKVVVSLSVHPVLCFGITSIYSWIVSFHYFAYVYIIMYSLFFVFLKNKRESYYTYFSADFSLYFILIPLTSRPKSIHTSLYLGSNLKSKIAGSKDRHILHFKVLLSSILLYNITIYLYI